MTIQASEVKVGEYFMAGSKKDQLRKVTELSKDAKKRVRVHYLSKSANIGNCKFSHSGTQSNPPLMKTFVRACDRVLSSGEVAQLRSTGIILAGE